jgi:hypothetical protein
MVESDHHHFKPEDQAMATIVIKDLQESIELDREAMHAIAGGSRAGARPAIFPGRSMSRPTRIFSYSGGFTSIPQTDAGRRSAGRKPLK